jgi:hypothetical protein
VQNPIVHAKVPTMADNVYRVIKTPHGGYCVERTQPGEPPMLTGDFGSRGAAYSWIDQDKEHASASRQWWRFWSPASRSR